VTRIVDDSNFLFSFQLLEGYSILRQRFGNDSFWIHGPYHYIMKAIFQGTGVYRAFSLHPFTTGAPTLNA
jgi:hypothetical protein